MTVRKPDAEAVDDVSVGGRGGFETLAERLKEGDQAGIGVESSAPTCRVVEHLLHELIAASVGHSRKRRQLIHLDFENTGISRR